MIFETTEEYTLAGDEDESGNVTLLQGLENAGFTVNQELAEFYKGLGYSRLVQNSWGQFAIGYTKIEAPVSAYSEELLENAKAFSDTALIVLSRIGGEGSGTPLDMADTVSSDAVIQLLQMTSNL